MLALLADAALGVNEVDAIAYGRGPGAFTGLRVACSVAQGLALGARKPVIALDTLLAVAEDARAFLASGSEGRSDATALPSLAVWALQDARMDEVYAAEYVHEAGTWRTRVAPCLSTPEALSARWLEAPPAVVAGNALPAFGTRLATGLAVRVPEAAPRGAALLTLADAAWAKGALLQAVDAVPLYVRDKVALTTAEREAVR